MNLEDFDFKLPENLIAQEPAKNRDESRLLFFDGKKNEIKEMVFKDLVNILDSNYVLVFNESRVVKARINFGKDEKKEILISKIITLEKNQPICSCLTNLGKKSKVGNEFELEKNLSFKIIGENGMERTIQFFPKNNDFDFFDFLEKKGKIPLPKYIKNNNFEESRYQTIFSKNGFSIAAPTAGLHFTNEIFDKLKEKNINIEFVNLNVGLGTFLPVKEQKIENHKMHSESFFISKKTADKLNQYKKEGKKIIAVGTTTIRVLETVANLNNGKLKEFSGETDIFIYPGYNFSFVDEVITNFHLPKSTLLMLISSYIGREKILELYNFAIKKEYRFFSFGDAMYLRK